MQPVLAQSTALETICGAARANPRKRRRFLRCIYHWSRSVFDVRIFFQGIAGYAWFLDDWRRYKALPGAERLRFIDSMPQLHDRTATTPFDAHYFFLNGWAMRRIVTLAPKSHVDVGSAVQFPNLLGAVIPTCFVDYRPLPARCEGLDSVAADIGALPFADNSLDSLSCLHVAEHIGLGRYGDPLDPAGTRKAARELVRVLAPGGSLFLGLPVGVERTCFNAHRIHAPETIRSYFEDLELMEFSGVHDTGRFIERARFEDFGGDVYACGMYWFRKPAERA
jgi:SAM-dependent methyltransferase